MASRHETTIRTAAAAAAAVGVPGVYSFGYDATLVSGIWTGMLVSIATESAHPMDRKFAAKVSLSVAKGVAAYVGGSKVAVQILRWIPGAGTVTAMGVNAGANYLYTYRLGHAFGEMFDRPDLRLGDASALASVLVPLVTKKPHAR